MIRSISHSRSFTFFSTFGANGAIDEPGEKTSASIKRSTPARCRWGAEPSGNARRVAVERLVPGSDQRIGLSVQR